LLPLRRFLPLFDGLLLLLLLLLLPGFLLLRRLLRHLGHVHMFKSRRQSGS
jgi:hypothetical protein